MEPLQLRSTTADRHATRNKNASLREVIKNVTLIWKRKSILLADATVTLLKLAHAKTVMMTMLATATLAVFISLT